MELGGGFFIPTSGLEGYKLRLAVALLLSAGLLLNRVLSPGEPGLAPVILAARLRGARRVAGGRRRTRRLGAGGRRGGAQREAEIAARAAALTDEGGARASDLGDLSSASGERAAAAVALIAAHRLWSRRGGQLGGVL